jgi:TM2 domain-containing membrane protein YozV
VIAAILAIALGGFGAHRFYLGDTTGGLIRLASSLLCLGWLIGLVEGIIYITKSDAEFTQTYEVEKKAWF